MATKDTWLTEEEIRILFELYPDERLFVGLRETLPQIRGSKSLQAEFPHLNQVLKRIEEEKKKH